MTMAIVEQSTRYKKVYGKWAGFPQGHQPDYSLCCEEVSDSDRWGRFHQCRKKRGHGPDGAYCKQHDPDAVTARRDAARARDAARWDARRYEIHGRRFFDALLKIADGHNDARGLAQEVVEEFRKGVTR